MKQSQYDFTQLHKSSYNLEIFKLGEVRERFTWRRLSDPLSPRIEQHLHQMFNFLQPTI